MISDSPPDRELEWTDEGIQSSKIWLIVWKDILIRINQK